jgi:hypothetical protein
MKGQNKLLRRPSVRGAESVKPRVCMDGLFCKFTTMSIKWTSAARSQFDGNHQETGAQIEPIERWRNGDAGTTRVLRGFLRDAYTGRKSPFRR